jgi:hypothetical protein
MEYGSLPFFQSVGLFQLQKRNGVELVLELLKYKSMLLARGINEAEIRSKYAPDEVVRRLLPRHEFNMQLGL